MESPGTFSWCDPHIWKGDLRKQKSAPSEAHREKRAGRPGASDPLCQTLLPPGAPRPCSCWGKNGRAAVLTLEASPGCSADNPVPWCGRASHRWQYWVLAEVATCGVCSWPLLGELCSSDSISERLLAPAPSPFPACCPAFNFNQLITARYHVICWSAKVISVSPTLDCTHLQRFEARTIWVWCSGVSFLL